jgi:hypothetical protein
LQRRKTCTEKQHETKGDGDEHASIIVEGGSVMLGLNYLAWIGIVSWIIVPLLALMATVLIWRRSQNALTNKAVALAVGFAILSAPTLVSNGVKAHYDQQVRGMCAKDGGVRVYETVKLPTERFDKWGNVGIHEKGYAKPTDEYYYESEVQYYREGNPTLLRSRSWVVRRSDGKVLGEAISYGRSGGDLPGPWHGSSFHCPPIADAEGKIESSIFLKENEK